MGWIVVGIAAIGLSVTPVVEADEFEVKEDLTVTGTGGTLKNPNLEVKGNAAIVKDLFIHDGSFGGPFGGLGRYQNLLTYSEVFDNAIRLVARMGVK